MATRFVLVSIATLALGVLVNLIFHEQNVAYAQEDEGGNGGEGGPDIYNVCKKDSLSYSAVRFSSLWRSAQAHSISIIGRNSSAIGVLVYSTLGGTSA